MPRIYKPKYTIDDMRQLAIKNNGKCLSDDFLRVDIQLTWQCQHGHIWNALPQNVLKGGWCIQCFRSSMKGKQKDNPVPKLFTIDDLHTIAKLHEGKCYATEYISICASVNWECKNGHRFKTSFNKIKNGKQWCRICKHTATKIKTVDRFRLYVAEKNGTVEKIDGTGSRAIVALVCSFGHSWTSNINRVVMGQWCPICANVNTAIRNKEREYDVKYTCNYANELAGLKGGKCLSTDLAIKTTSHLVWVCSLGHTWEARLSHVQEGSWCLICSIKDRSLKQRKYQMKDVRQIAEARLGKCISHLDKNNENSIVVRDKGTFICADGHEWSTRFEAILNGHWCMQCAYEERRLGKNSKNIRQGLATSIANESLPRSASIQALTELMKELSSSKLHPLETPIFDSNT